MHTIGWQRYTYGKLKKKRCQSQKFRGKQGESHFSGGQMPPHSAPCGRIIVHKVSVSVLIEVYTDYGAHSRVSPCMFFMSSGKRVNALVGSESNSGIGAWSCSRSYLTHRLLLITYYRLLCNLWFNSDMVSR